jgi:eukaryotic-like serine/threonine-protein kinase
MVASGMVRGGTEPTAATRTAEPETDDRIGVGPVAGAFAPTAIGSGVDTPALRPGAVVDAVDRAPAPLQTRERERYQIIEEHGRGGLGRVLRARDRELDRTVAIKELLRRGHSAEIRFFREALITARLEHPGIVPVHEAGRWPDGTPFYAMKLVAGRPLRDLILDAGSIEARLALVPHVVAVADAIAYAHARRIVHRDLKPANVIVGDYGETVVIDWGLAKDLTAHERETAGEPYRTAAAPDDLTVAGTVLGTPAFMAPEQARGGAGDERSDVYALGALLYAVLAGQAPYHGSRSEDIVRAVVDGPPPPLGSAAPGAPADLVAIASAAMARSVDDRLPSARAFADDLRRYLQGQLVRSHRYSAAERALRWMRRHRELSIASAVAASALVVLGAVAVSRIVDERNSADRERRRAEDALRSSRNQGERLILTNARTETERNPTAALGWLQQYGGSDVDKAQELAAIASARFAASFSRNSSGVRITDAGAVSFAPPRVVSLGSDRVVRLWRSGAVEAVVLSRDAAVNLDFTRAPLAGAVAFAASNGDIEVVDRDGTARVALSVPTPTQALYYTQDGAWLVAASRSGAIRVAGGDQRRSLQLPAEAGDLHNAWISRNGATVVACAKRGGLWRHAEDLGWARLGDCSLEEGYHTHVSDDGAWITTGVGPRLQLLHARSGASVAFPPWSSEITLARFLSDGHVVVGTRDGDVYDAAPDGSSVRRLFTADGAPFMMAESARGDVAVGFGTGAVRITNRRSDHVDRVTGLRSRVTGLHWSPDGGQLFASDRNEMRVLPAPQRLAWSLEARASYRSAESPDGRWLAVDSQGGDVLLLDRRANAAAPPRRLRGHTATARGVAFVGDVLLSAGGDGTIRRWSAPTWVPETLVQGAAQIRWMVASDAEHAVAVDSDHRVFSLSARGAATLLHQSTAPVHRVAAATAAQVIALLGENGAVQLLDGASRAVRTVASRPVPSNAVAFSPGGARFAVGSADGLLEIRSVAGQLEYSARHGTRCNAIAMSPGDDLIAACGRHLVILRRTPAGWTAHTRELEGDLYAVDVSPDGRLAAAGSTVGLVYLVDLASGALAAQQVGANLITSVRFSADGREVVATTFSPEIYAIAVDRVDFVAHGAAALHAWLSARRDSDDMPSWGARTP